MSHEELRRALADVVRDAPTELRRSEQVWARHRRHRRRSVVLSLGTLALLCTGLVFVTSPAGEPSHLVTVKPSATPTPSLDLQPDPAPPEGTPSPGGVPPPGGVPSPQPGRTPDPEPSRHPTPSPTTSGGLAPLPAGVLSYTAPWHLMPGGGTLTSVYPYAADSGLDRITIDWGDGSPPQVTVLTECPEKDGRGRRVVGHQPRTPSYHPYAAAGQYEIRVTAHFAGCGLPSQTRSTTSRVYVDDQPVGSEGRVPPTGEFAQTEVRTEARPGKIATSLDVTDDDLVAFAFIIWGDGTASVLREQLPSWCGSSPAPLDPEWPAYAEHTYQASGSWSTTAVVRSATCDGGGYATLARDLTIQVSD